MQWQKLGLLYSPCGIDRHPKLLSHAANPLPILIENDTYRIFFSGRDSNNRSSVGAVDIDIVKQKIIQEHKNPFFEHGPKDSFYADGVSIGNCYEVNGTRYILFMGWQNQSNTHWRGDIGRLIVKPDLTLTLDMKKAFIGCDEIDPISLSYPWVMRDITSDNYKMWYGTTKTWDAGNNEMLHTINYAESADGHQWIRKGVAVPYELGKAQAFSKPSVVSNTTGTYEMWFSYRSGNGEKYRIGYALSIDGQQWELKVDDRQITPSLHGWDSEMIEYPFVFEHKNERYMIYNGNGFGKTGFGLAILERS